jgi:hypothetical protein
MTEQLPVNGERVPIQTLAIEIDPSTTPLGLLLDDPPESLR